MPLPVDDPIKGARPRGGGRRRRPVLRADGPTYGALDLGTNNCRLLVAQPADGGGFEVIDAFSRIVRLGEGLSSTGRLSDRAIGRTIEALRVCARKLRRHKTERMRLIATEACRKAENCPNFIKRVEVETGLNLEIITSDEEARLALVGCAPLLDRPEPNAIVFDIGGGSTEIIWVEGSEDGDGHMASATASSTSVPIGVVNFAEKYGGDTFNHDEYEAMVADAMERLMPFEREHGIAAKVHAGRVQVLGTSGTVTTLASVHMGLKQYDRSRIDGCYLELEDMNQVIRRLSGMSYADRADFGCIGLQRADLVVGGAAILDAICRLWPAPVLRVADRGLREGILMMLMAADGHMQQPATADG